MTPETLVIWYAAAMTAVLAAVAIYALSTGHWPDAICYTLLMGAHFIAWLAAYEWRKG